MKIDIHTHTRKCKTGDAATREISPEDFCNTVLATDVGIIAVTNHNVFDLHQFEAIQTRLNGQVQVWPGIELDVLGGQSRGHLLVIVSPKLASEFSSAVDALTENATADSFTATIEEILKSFEVFHPLYVAHYKQKRPAISDEVLDVLINNTARPECVIKEVTNSISAGIYISHGHSSIYGSDIHDWGKYKEISGGLPDLRLPVNSFEHFCLLLKKDPTTINTVLDKKTAEDLVIRPFGDGTVLTLKAFNDINIFFGPKGTGKSCILIAIAKHYAERGIDATVHAPSSDRLEVFFDVKGKNLAINLEPYGINYCTDQIEALRRATEVSVTSLDHYVRYFKATNTNKSANQFLLKDIDPEDGTVTKREFNEFNAASKKVQDFLNVLNADPAITKELSEEELVEVVRILSSLLQRLAGSAWESFVSWKEVVLLNAALTTVRLEVQRKTGKPAKPTTTGFRDYAMNRVAIEVNAGKIIASVESAIPTQSDDVGNLGSGKGELQFVTAFKFQNGSVSDAAFVSLTKVNKGLQKKFIQSVKAISTHTYADDLFEQIAALNAIENAEEIKSVHELLLFSRYFALAGQAYAPSSGESSMVMLQKELSVDKDVYILDEPEKSLGNEYISDVIVPLIKERARSGKKVFISTHDANIAVRTLPYSSVYRCYGQAGYKTYIGNPFTNNLVNPEDLTDQLDWKKISMKTLEGGEEAFGERGKIYGTH